MYIAVCLRRQQILKFSYYTRSPDDDGRKFTKMKNAKAGLAEPLFLLMKRGFPKFLPRRRCPCLRSSLL